VSWYGRLRAGPAFKTPAWRAGSFFVGWGAILLVLGLISIGPLSVSGLGRLIVLLLVIGVGLSLPYGVAWLRGREPKPPHEPDPVPVKVAEIPTGEPGNTYVVVDAAPRIPRVVRYRELSPFWYFLAVVFWRAPVTLGDWILCGLWSVIGWIVGRSDTFRPSGGPTLDGDEGPPGPTPF
jgi:hypothetical protein